MIQKQELLDQNMDQSQFLQNLFLELEREIKLAATE
jgi:hypothetical protein